MNTAARKSGGDEQHRDQQLGSVPTARFCPSDVSLTGALEFSFLMRKRQMDYLSKTQPNWPRFAGISTYARLPHRSEPVGNGFAVFGVPFDLGRSFCSGSRFGPSAVREASRHIRVANAVHRINIYDHVAGIDYGDAPVYPFELERSLGSIEEFVSGLVLAGTVPIGIGGDHTVSLPILRALARASGRLSLVHFDAHSDTENVLFGSRINHGTTFRRCAEEGLIDPQKSIQIGMRGSTADLSEIDQARELGFAVIDSTLMNSLSI